MPLYFKDDAPLCANLIRVAENGGLQVWCSIPELWLRCANQDDEGLTPLTEHEAKEMREGAFR
jgi:hypothetical protein